ncbi:MAG: transposase [Chloroflexi bacterium]|nr:transposase [Chloroflexota bacterium]
MKIREKHHRLPRQAYHGEVIAAFTICVDNRVRLFTDHEVVGAFINILRAAAERWSCIVGIYCFMPDHLHVILQGESPTANIWETVVEFKQRSGYWLARQRPGVVWQKDFHDHIFRHSEDIAKHVRYILDNSCRAGLVTEWEQYPFKGAIGCRLEDVLGGLPCRGRGRA